MTARGLRWCGQRIKAAPRSVNAPRFFSPVALGFTPLVDCVNCAWTRIPHCSMGWLASLLIISSFNFMSASPAVPSQQFPIGSQDIDMTGYFGPINPEEDLVLQNIGRNLAEILVQDWPSNELPIIYVEEDPGQTVDFQQISTDGDDTNFRPAPYKRTRYYRKYPWKRQNSRYPYDAENRYMCQPSKDDVFRLLVALHEARQGSRGRTINFCNRKRPASSIFTNIRFLGKK